MYVIKTTLSFNMYVIQFSLRLLYHADGYKEESVAQFFLYPVDKIERRSPLQRWFNNVSVHITILCTYMYGGKEPECTIFFRMALHLSSK